MPNRSLLSFARYIATAAFLVAGTSVAIHAQKPYHIVDHWTIGGEGGWDYLTVDSAAHLLYVAHNTRVDVLDTTTGKSVGTIAGIHGSAHGIALDTSGKYGYISDGYGDAVVVFDRTSLQRIATIPVGNNPDAILFEPATLTVWAFNGRSKSASVIDATTHKVVATIPLPGKPEFAVTDGKGLIYDNIEDKNEVIRLDAHTRTVTATWPLGCKSPSGLAYDASGNRLFSTCDNRKMAVTDAGSGESLALPPICDGPDGGGYAPEQGLAFASCGEGILTVVNAANPSYPAIEMLPTERGARTMAYDPGADRIYTVTADFGPPPAPTAINPRPRPTIVPGSFQVLVIGR